MMKESDRVLWVEDQSEDPASARQSGRQLTNLTEHTPVSTSPLPSPHPEQPIDEAVNTATRVEPEQTELQQPESLASAQA